MPSWVVRHHEVEREEEAAALEARRAHVHALEVRHAVSDALGDLSLDELILLESELLIDFDGKPLSMDSCASILNLLGLRLGKMFDPIEVSDVVHGVIDGAANGNQTCSGVQLLAGLKRAGAGK